MIAYYELTESLYDHLIVNEDVNTCKIGNIDQVDFNKQQIYPFAHILVTSAVFIEGVVRFSITIGCIDVIDITKGDIRDENEVWKELDNKQDVMNTMLAVLEVLNKSLVQGTLQESGWELQDNMIAEPVEETLTQAFVAGWSTDLVVEIPNTNQNC